MPQILRNAVDVARERNADVLLAVFGKEDLKSLLRKGNKKDRNKAIRWLESNGYKWEDCYHPYVQGFLAAPWDGTIAIDVAIDLEDDRCSKLLQQFEDVDGCPKWPGIRLQILQNVPRQNRDQG